MAIKVRASTQGDIPAITAIYAHYVIHATCSFELTPPSEAEMAARRKHILEEKLPWFVAEQDGRGDWVCIRLEFSCGLPQFASRTELKSTKRVANGFFEEAVGCTLCGIKLCATSA